MMNRSLKVFRVVLASAALPFAFIPAPAAVAASVTIVDSNCASFSWDANAQTLSCVTGSTPAPAGAPSGCTLTASPTSLPVGGGMVALTAQCASGNATNYSWTGGNVASPTAANTQSVSVSTTTTFAVTPSNSAGSGTTQYANVTVASAPTPPPAGAISCSGFNSTKVIDATLPGNGSATTRLYTYDGIFSYGGAGWGARDAIVLRFTAPSAGDQYMSIAMTATGGSVRRTMSLSPDACDFSKSSKNVYYVESNSLNLDFSSGPSVYVRTVLNPGQTYYLNMANLDNGTPSCPDSTCDAVILLQNPNP
jgi:hypothetical protein